MTFPTDAATITRRKSFGIAAIFYSSPFQGSITSPHEVRECVMRPQRLTSCASELHEPNVCRMSHPVIRACADPDIGILALAQEQHADDAGHERHHGRVPKSVVDVAGRGTHTGR